jgi:DNA-directed RNA polymerase specialized sigma24 family protein
MTRWREMLVALERGHETCEYELFAECVRDCAFAWYLKAYHIETEEAESLANEVAVKLWVNAPRIRLESAERYIRRAIANTGREYLRKRKEIAYNEWDIMCAMHAEASGDALEWTATLAVMSPEEREVAERLVSGQSRTDIGRELGMSSRYLDAVIESIRRRLKE